MLTQQERSSAQRGQASGRQLPECGGDTEPSQDPGWTTRLDHMTLQPAAIHPSSGPLCVVQHSKMVGVWRAANWQTLTWPNIPEWKHEKQSHPAHSNISRCYKYGGGTDPAAAVHMYHRFGPEPQGSALDRNPGPALGLHMKAMTTHPRAGPGLHLQMKETRRA